MAYPPTAWTTMAGSTKELRRQTVGPSRALLRACSEQRTRHTGALHVKRQVVCMTGRGGEEKKEVWGCRWHHTVGEMVSTYDCGSSSLSDSKMLLLCFATVLVYAPQAGCPANTAPHACAPECNMNQTAHSTCVTRVDFVSSKPNRGKTRPAAHRAPTGRDRRGQRHGVDHSSWGRPSLVWTDRVGHRHQPCRPRGPCAPSIPLCCSGSRTW